MPVAYAEPTAARVVEQLDEYAGDWTTMHREACEATRIRGEQSARMLDLRMACLDRGARELEAMIEQLEQAELELLPRAVTAVAGLTPIAACGDTEALASMSAPPESGEVRERVDAVREQLDRVHVLLLTSQHEQAMTVIEAAKPALPPEYPLVAAELRHLEGNVMIRQGRFDEARLALHEALLGSLRERDLVRVGSVCASLSFLVGYILGDYERGLELADEALAFADATGDERLRSAALGQKGIVLHAQHRLVEALPYYEQTIETLPEDSPNYELELANRLYNLALARREKGENEAALALLRRVKALYLELLGSDRHPNLIDVDDAIGVTVYYLGRLDEAATVLEQVLERREQVLAADHPDFVTTHNSLASVYFSRGDYEHQLRLARALVGRDRGELARARSLAEAAANGYRKLELDARAAEVEVWLDGCSTL